MRGIINPFASVVDKSKSKKPAIGPATGQEANEDEIGPNDSASQINAVMAASAQPTLAPSPVAKRTRGAKKPSWRL